MHSALTGAAAQSFRGATIVTKPEIETEGIAAAVPMGDGIFYGTESLMPFDIVYNNDKRVRRRAWLDSWGGGFGLGLPR